MHPVINLIDPDNLLKQRITRGCQKAIFPRRVKNLYKCLILGAAPVGARTMTAIMADIEGLIPPGRFCVMDRAEFITIGVASGPCEVFPEQPRELRVLVLAARLLGEKADREYNNRRKTKTVKNNPLSHGKWF